VRCLAPHDSRVAGSVEIKVIEICFHCDIRNHFAQDCRKPKKEEALLTNAVVCAQPSRVRHLCVCDSVGLCPRRGRATCIVGLWVCASSCVASTCVRAMDVSSFGEFMVS
jgi:hypothetical protein